MLGSVCGDGILHFITPLSFSSHHLPRNEKKAFFSLLSFQLTGDTGLQKRDVIMQHEVLLLLLLFPCSLRNVCMTHAHMHLPGDTVTTSKIP